MSTVKQKVGASVFAFFFFLRMVQAERTHVSDVINIRPSTLPGTGRVGDMRHDTSTNVIKSWDGDSWDSIVATGGNLTFATQTSTYTLTTSDEGIYADASSGSFTLELFTAVGNAGKQLYLCKAGDANTVTIDPNGSQTINNSTTAELFLDDDCMVLMSDNAKWVKQAERLNPITVQMVPGSNVTLTDASIVEVAFNTTTSDSHSAFSTANSSFVAPRDGTYSVNCGFLVAMTTTGTQVRVDIDDSFTSMIYRESNAGAIERSFWRGERFYVVDNGEAVTVDIFQNSGADKTLGGDDGTNSYCQINEVR